MAAADRLTQMQHMLQDLGKHMQDAIGVLHQSTLSDTARSTQERTDYVQGLVRHFSQLIALTARDFERFTHHLPNLRHGPTADFAQLATRSDAASFLLAQRLFSAQALLARLRGLIVDTSAALFLDEMSKPESLLIVASGPPSAPDPALLHTQPKGGTADTVMPQAAPSEPLPLAPDAMDTDPGPASPTKTNGNGSEMASEHTACAKRQASDDLQAEAPVSDSAVAVAAALADGKHGDNGASG
jgi:hypothetical protein